MNAPRVLVYGYGNPGRQDDAVGVMLAERVEKWVNHHGLDWVETDQGYQLNIEDADRIADFDYVIFADASVKNIGSCLLETIEPDPRTDFTMHAVEPAFVVGVCEKLFQRKPRCYQLHIRAYHFEFMEEPSKEALSNLELAHREVLAFITKLGFIKEMTANQ